MLRSIRKRLMMCILRAGVAKLVYAPDSKSGVRQGHVGSSPTSGTNPFSTNEESGNFGPQIIAAADKFRLAGMSVVDVDPSLATTSVSHPNLCFLANKEASLWIRWVKFLILIKSVQYSRVRWQNDQFSMNHSSRQRIQYCTGKFPKVVKSSTNLC